MGQKVNPIGFRLAVNKDWRSKWYATGQDYATKLHEDLVMRKYIKEQLMSAAVSSIVIERAWNSVRITVHTARPGLVIGRKGEEIEKIRQYLRACAALPPRSTLTSWKSVLLKRTPSSSLKTWPSSWNAAFPSAAP